MGIQIKGSNDTISASDGSMVLEGSALTFDNESITGISTMATGHITGTATIDDDLKVGISTLFVDKSAGRVGIGTDNPQVRLTVSSDSPAVMDVHHVDGGTNDEARIILGALALNPPSNRGAGIAAVNNGAGHDLIIKCSASHAAGPTEKVRVTSAGDVGIGEDSPGNRLVVQKTSASGDVGIRVKNDTLTDGSASTPTTASLYLNTSTADFNTFYLQTRRYDNDTHFGYGDPRASGHLPTMCLTNDFQVGISTVSFTSGSKFESSSEGAYNIIARSQNGNGGYHNFTGQSSGGTNTSYITHNGRGYFEDGVQFDSAGEVLDSYEEGIVTWASNNDTDISFDSNYKGRYTKIGELVTVSGYILVDSYTSSGNAIRITMPFTSAQNSEGYYTRGVGATFSRNMNFPANYENMVAYVGGGENYMRFYMTRMTGGSAEWHQMRASDFTSTTGIYFNVCYTTTS
jgi:hypothetical protein